jgi:hypothetical protein
MRPATVFAAPVLVRLTAVAVLVIAGSIDTARGEDPTASVASRVASPATPVAGAAHPVASTTDAGHGATHAGTAGSQAIRGEDVLIEGKLYSPQALFIVSRTAETFGRDAVVPYTLHIGPTTRLAPYRVQTSAPQDSMARDEH